MNANVKKKSSYSQIRYLENVVLPIHLEHMRARSAATNTFTLVEGAAFTLGGTLLPSDFSFVNLALPIFAILAAVSLLLWDSRNRYMIGLCLQIGAEIEEQLTTLQATPILRSNLHSIQESRWPTLMGITSHTWAIRILAFGAIGFWSIYLLQNLGAFE